MSRDRFDEILGQRLGEFREEPPTGMFDRIEATLGKAQPVPVRRPLWSRPIVRYASTAVAAACIFAGVVIVSRRAADRHVQPTVAEVPTVQQATAAPVSESTTASVVTVKRRKPHVKHKPMAVAITSEAPEEQMTTTPSEATKTVPAATEPKPKAPVKITKADKKRMSDSELEEYWRQVLAEDAPRRHGRNYPAELSLYAANVGFDRGNISVSNISANPLLVTEAATTKGMSTFAAAAPAGITPPKLKHFMPVTIGFTLGYALNNWMAIESGVTYTNMFSRSENWGSMSSYQRRRDLHFIGIPVAATFNLANVYNLSLYARIGGAAEKCVSAVDRYYIDGAVNSTEPLSADGLQFSVDDVAGLNYAVVKGWGIYVESGISYYFPSGRQPESYRTENPLGMTARAGIRFTFR